MVTVSGVETVAPPPSLNFHMSENFLFVEKLSSKSTNFGAENLPFGEI